MDETFNESSSASANGVVETPDNSFVLSGMNSSDRSGSSWNSRFDVKRFFNNKQYSDIVLEFTCEDGSVQIPSHKLVLSQSPFFERAMNIGMCEAENNHLVIRDVPPQVGMAITGFFYGLDFEITEDHLLKLLTTLDRLQICELVEETSERLKKLLNANNALKLASGIAEGCPSMHSSWIPICSAFISGHEDEIAETDTFLDLDLDTVMFLVSVRDPPIFVSPVSFVIRWLQKQQAVSDFLRHSLSKSSLTNNDKVLSGILRDAIFSFDSFATLAKHIGYDDAKKYMEEYLADNISPFNAFAFVSASFSFKNCDVTKELNTRFDWHELVCMEYVRLNAKEVLENEGIVSLEADIVRTLAKEDRIFAHEDDIFRAVLRWATWQTSFGEEEDGEHEKRVKKLLKDTGIIELIRFPTMSLNFFHQVVEKSGVIPSRLLLERYQYHHGSLTYCKENVRLHNRLPMWLGKGCYACNDPSHPASCERWVIACSPSDNGMGFNTERICYKGPEIRTCGGDLWGVTVFPPGTDEREIRGSTLAHNEWAVNIRRLSQDTNWTLTQCSTGLSRRFNSLNETFWDLGSAPSISPSLIVPHSAPLLSSCSFSPLLAFL
ncbi:hypothetical protein GUITHDRAFT_139415 [Guillardia theta CCMP2712]|uniref:BTB domain-containing protein n=1 Tax=Guillardia theta (strain CCMP2712) TaxID=905079 RepID=L1J9P6_GUITC|nr:hypothetical protein GUITHDRAFT_139415 [Guillardia theta CCMP2712]EKX44790.1 hypothetical protein GUITHDRAFT_139415 [Guillardia theta CCMP2712]|eukprot:XP_005831770.1 hypothetical protein GUITHDRAFT_139415 [Guillardia theta CCMP2712]